MPLMLSSCFSALWPSWAITTFSPLARRAFDMANMLRTSSSTTSTVLPDRPGSDFCTAATAGLVTGRRLCRNRLTSSSSRSGDRAPLITMLSV